MMLLGAMVCLAGGLLAVGSTLHSLNKGRRSGRHPPSDDAETTAKNTGVRRRRGKGTKHRAKKTSVPKPDGGRRKSECREEDFKKPALDNASWISIEQNPLNNVEELFNSCNPAIVSIATWFGSYVMNIDPDGNCFGTSWLIAAIVWAAQSPTRLQHLISTLEEACRPDQAFGCLGPTCTIYVDELVTYLKTLADDWIGHAAYDTAYGAFLAVNVVKTFMGENYPGYTIDHDSNEEPLWLRLKWGVAIASRALDVWTSCRHGIDDTSDYTEFFAAATNAPGSRTTTGLAVHQAGLPHFDVIVTPHVGGLFFNELAAAFRLRKPVEDDAGALRILRLRTESQRKHTAGELKNIIAEDELAEQIAAMKARCLNFMVH
eukprot:jgi/Undpi1/7066/HiC_scaffold_21.g09540.m1